MNEQDNDEYQKRRTETIFEGLGIVLFGGILAFTGFRYGYRKQLKFAEEQEQIVLNGGVSQYKKLAIRALVRGSAVASVIAMISGIGLSYYVEARHKPIPKEQEAREMAELWKELGLTEDGKEKSE